MSVSLLKPFSRHASKASARCVEAMEGTTRSAVARARKRNRKRREEGRAAADDADAEAPVRQVFLGGTMVASGGCCACV